MITPPISCGKIFLTHNRTFPILPINKRKFLSIQFNNSEYSAYESGGASNYWVQFISFPSGKIAYKLISEGKGPDAEPIVLTVDGLDKDLSMSCESGDSVDKFLDAYNKMEELKFKVK